MSDDARVRPDTTRDPLLELDGVRVEGMGDRTPLRLDLRVAAGEAVGVVASSHVGARLLRACLGFEPTLEGEIVLLGRETSELETDGTFAPTRKEVGAALRPHGLIQNITLRENLLLPLLFRPGTGEADPDLRVEALLDGLGLAEVGEQRPAQAGSGACERAAVGRALACGPEVLLLENLDAALTAREIHKVLSLCRLEARAVLVTATEPGSAACMRCNRVVDLSDA